MMKDRPWCIPYRATHQYVMLEKPTDVCHADIFPRTPTITYGGPMVLNLSVKYQLLFTIRPWILHLGLHRRV